MPHVSLKEFLFCVIATAVIMLIFVPRQSKQCVQLSYTATPPSPELVKLFEPSALMCAELQRVDIDDPRCWRQ
jgi:hypothetical protein